MKHIGRWLVIVAGIVCFSVMGFSSMALKPVAAGTIPGLVLVNTQDSKSLLLGSEQRGLAQKLLDAGVLSADIKTLVFKEKNEFRYAIYGDIHLGTRFMENQANVDGIELPYTMVTRKYVGTSKEYTLEAVHRLLGAYVETHSQSYSFLMPTAIPGFYTNIPVKEALKRSAQVKDQAQILTIQASFHQKDHVYSEIIHVQPYMDPYYGPSLRFVALQTLDDHLLWPIIAHKYFEQ